MVSQGGYTLALADTSLAAGSDVPLRFTVTGPDGEPVLLERQNRRRWDHAAIRRGRAALARATQVGRGLGAYGLQAAIAECHAVAASVEEGRVTAGSMIDCEGGGWNIGRARIRDDHPHGVITIRELLKYSSNIGSAKLALELGAEKSLAYFRAFGFGERTGVALQDGSYETVAGYVLHRLARMAEVGDRVTVADHVLEVVEVDGHRITRVRLHAAAPPDPDRRADPAE